MKTYILFFMLIFANKCFATLAGPEVIEINGFDPVDQKVFITRYYVDETGRMPSLYYFQLNGKHPDKPIQVKSFFENLPNDDEANIFSQRVAELEDRLKPLQASSQESLKLRTISQNVIEGDFWQHHYTDDTYLIKKYTSNFYLESSTTKSNNHSVTSYKDPNISILNFYQIPNTKYQLAIIRYHGIPIETGYSRDDAILLFPTQ